MKSKVLNALLILTSLAGYLEWGTDNSSFLFQAEAEIITKIFRDPVSVLHPFILLPMAGQMLLIFTLFQNKVSKRLTFIGLAGIGILIVLMFVIGVLSLNVRIVFSAIPFIIVAFLTIKHNRNNS